MTMAPEQYGPFATTANSQPNNHTLLTGNNQPHGTYQTASIKPGTGAPWSTTATINRTPCNNSRNSNNGAPFSSMNGDHGTILFPLLVKLKATMESDHWSSRVI
jgi:hypothetical protein